MPADGISAGTVTSYTFSNVTANHTISVTFAINTYTITSSAGAGGTISPNGITTVNYGSSKTYTITPGTGYHVANVVMDGSSSGALTSYTFANVTTNHTISATFAINTYTITSSTGAGGTISPNGTTTVNYGASQAYSITPAPGYHVASVIVDGISKGAVTSYTFTSVSANHTISATFTINTYTITSSAGTGGTISPTGTTTVNYGGSQTYTITPNTGYHVTNVTADGISVGAVTSYTFNNVTANHTISTTFAINTYTIVSSAGANGTISPNGTTTVNYGSSKTYTITPGAGYHIADVQVDGASNAGAISSGSYTFSNVTANHTISATFAINSYTLTSSAGANGTITPNGTMTVNYGSSQSYTIIANTGYHVADVQVDGSSVGAKTSYTFSGIKANHSISATFALNTYTITSSAGTNGTITPLGATTVSYGGSQAYTITPNAGYQVTKVLVDGTSVGTVTTYTFTTVTANHTISVTFSCILPSAPVIAGPSTVTKQQDNLVYTVTNAQPGVSYTWTVPSGVTIESGQGTASITVKWGNNSGNVGCTASNTCGSSTKSTYAVTIGTLPNLITLEPDSKSIQPAYTTTLKVNPNPVYNNAKVIFSVAEPSKCNIQLLDLKGRVLGITQVNAIKGFNEVDLDVSHFAVGTYFVSLVHGKEIKTVILLKVN